MSAASNSAAPLGRPDSFELKSGQLPLVSLLLKSTDLAHLADEWDAHYGDNPGFFDKDPLVIDLSHLSDPTVPDFKALLTLLKRRNVCPMAVKGGNAQQLAAAVKAGWWWRKTWCCNTCLPRQNHPPLRHPPPLPRQRPHWRHLPPRCRHWWWTSPFAQASRCTRVAAIWW
jgi:hypothetical protein